MTAHINHIPVLLDEVIHALAITPGSEIVDGTFGAGGYSQACGQGGENENSFDTHRMVLRPNVQVEIGIFNLNGG